LGVRATQTYPGLYAVNPVIGDNEFYCIYHSRIDSSLLNMFSIIFRAVTPALGEKCKSSPSEREKKILVDLVKS